MQNEEFEDQSVLIERSLLKWISLIKKNKVESFRELTTGQFYLDLLSKAPSFKLIKSLKTFFQGQTYTGQQEQRMTLVNKISNMKIIGESIIRYYQTELMRDVSQMKINYVQLCMEEASSSESIKLLSLLIGIFTSLKTQQNHQGQIVYINMVSAMNSLEQEDKYIVNALLENSTTIGDSFISKKDDSPIRKTIISKLETYQEKIDVIEQQNFYLKQDLENQRSKIMLLQNKLKDLKSQKTKIVQKTQVLEILNTGLQTENSSLTFENEKNINKIAKLKQVEIQLKQKEKDYELEIERLMSENYIFEQKIVELKAVNSDLQFQLNERTNSHKNDEEKLKLLKTQFHKIQKSHQKMLKLYNQMEQDTQKLNRKGSQQYSDPNASSYQAQIINSNTSQLSSVKYHLKDNLSMLGSQLSKVELINSVWQRNVESTDKKQLSNLIGNDKLSKEGYSATAIDHSNIAEKFVDQSNRKINKIGNNIIQNVSEFSIENLDESAQIDQSQQGQLNGQIRDLDYKEQDVCYKKLNQETTQLIRKIQERYHQEHSILITSIKVLFDQNQRLNRELRQFQQIKHNKQRRHQAFKKKVQTVYQLQSPLLKVNTKDSLKKQLFDKQNSMNFSNQQQIIPLSHAKK